MKNMIYNSLQSRNRTIDITRGIAIFSIIIGHLRIALINRVVFTFHVPIFFILTGYFIRQEPIGSFVKKKVKSILVPYAVTCIVIILLAGAIALIQDGNSDAFDVMRSWRFVYGAICYLFYWGNMVLMGFLLGITFFAIQPGLENCFQGNISRNVICSWVYNSQKDVLVSP